MFGRSPVMRALPCSAYEKSRSGEIVDRGGQSMRYLASFLHFHLRNIIDAGYSQSICLRRSRERDSRTARLAHH